MKRFTTKRTTYTLLVLSLAAAAAQAGDLMPPPGPIAPTMKPLSQVEPRIAINSENTPGDDDALFKITAPGSYYLAGNVSGEPAKHGIEVAAPGVTIDLMGFDLAGVPGSLDGIRLTGPDSHALRVHNGTVRNWEGFGIRAGGGYRGEVFEDVRARDNGGVGISVGYAAVVTRCTASDNDLSGIEVGIAATVEQCASIGNGQSGILTNIGAVVRGCTAYFNTLHGIAVDSHCLIEGCTANNNFGDGIRCFANTRIVNNVCIVNSFGAGIHASNPANHIEGNYVSGNIRGIDADVGGNFIARNTARDNATNYEMTGTQTIGPIITATGTITTTNPWANFSF